MAFTVAEARGDKNSTMHCSRGHTCTYKNAHHDPYGTWCPECGNGLTTGPQTPDCWCCKKQAKK